jgi:hypothetical protein
LARYGTVGIDTASQARLGKVWLGMAWLGRERYRRLG